eukprot:17518-Heterococcus_DN1.PRE.1
MCSVNEYGVRNVLTFGPKTTLYSVAVSSPATARLACESGLQINADDSLQLIAGLHADLPTLTVLRELGMLLSETLVNAVARSGRLGILQHLLTEQTCPRPIMLSFNAALSGNISMLNWLKAQGWCEMQYGTCAGAAKGGHLELLQHLRSEGFEWDKHHIVYCAAGSGSIEMIEWLRQQQSMQIDAEVLSWAAGAGKTAMCQHLRSVGCDWDIHACESATADGHLDTLRWLRENGCPWIVNDVCMVAAAHGRVTILDFVIEQGEVLDAELLTDALNTAGAGNKLQAAQWLRQH